MNRRTELALGFAGLAVAVYALSGCHVPGALKVPLVIVARCYLCSRS
jgi:hypothetical protein